MTTVANPVPCYACPLEACPGLIRHEPELVPWLEKFKTGETAIDRGEVLVEQGSEAAGLYTVLDGVLMRYHSLNDGRRQIVNFMFPGDFIGLQGAFGDPASHSVEALLPSRLCTFDSGAFYDLIAEQPTLGYDITWLAAKEENALEAHLGALGQRTAKERVAYLALWLLRRAISTCTAADGTRLQITITQSQIADMLGLSLVHTNRTIKTLEREGLVFWRTNRIEIPDPDAVADFAKMGDEATRSRPYI